MRNQVLQFLVPNEATGHKIIQLTNWNGKCLVVPRTELKKIENRPETRDPGVYFLFGESDGPVHQKLYIGESERFYGRVTNHNISKDFWNLAVIFTGGLDKAKVKYLEYLSITEALKASRYDLVNNVSPKENNLNEFDAVIVQDYFSKITYILSVLGYPVFQDIQDSLSANHQMYFLKGDSFDAKSQLLEDGSMNVLKGSLARIKETESFGGWALSARKEFLESNVLKNTADNLSYVFTKDVLFKSPSAAAATIAGRSINGWTAWKDKEGNTLDENLRK